MSQFNHMWSKPMGTKVLQFWTILPLESIQYLNFKLDIKTKVQFFLPDQKKILRPKWSTTPIMVGKLCWKPHCHNEVLDRLQSCIVGKSRWEEVQFLSLHRGDTKVGFTIFHPQKSWQKMLILESVQRPKLYLALNYQSEFQILNGLLTVTN